MWKVSWYAFGKKVDAKFYRSKTDAEYWADLKSYEGYEVSVELVPD